MVEPYLLEPYRNGRRDTYEHIYVGAECTTFDTMSRAEAGEKNCTGGVLRHKDTQNCTNHVRRMSDYKVVLWMAM